MLVRSHRILWAKTSLLLLFKASLIKVWVNFWSSLDLTEAYSKLTTKIISTIKIQQIANPSENKLGWAPLNLRLRQLAWNSGWYLYIFTIVNFCLGFEGRSGHWLLRYSNIIFEVIFHWKPSSIGGRLRFKDFWFGIGPLKIKFKIWGRSDQ